MIVPTLYPSPQAVAITGATTSYGRRLGLNGLFFRDGNGSVSRIGILQETKEMKDCVAWRMHNRNVHVHNGLCGCVFFLDTVLPHQRLEIGSLHVDFARSFRNVPIITDERFLDEEFFDFLYR